MQNLAIIPARSGSKGLKNKNIKMLRSKPLLAYSILAAVEANIFDEIHVSTDSTEYAEIAKAWGASVPFLREKELAGDHVSMWDTVRGILKQYEEIGKKFDTVFVLQPTSPLRTAENILEAYSIYKRYKANAVISVCQCSHSPLWCGKLENGLLMDHFFREEIENIARQRLPSYYQINGAIYVRKVGQVMENRKLYDESCYAYIMDKEKSIDIDDEMDFKIADVFIRDREDQDRQV